MKWLRRYIEKRRPEYVDSLGFVWPLWTTRKFGLAIVLRFRSDTSFDQVAEVNRLRWVVDGEYIEHQELPRLGEHTPAVDVEEGAYVYSNDYGLYMARTIVPRQLTIEPAGRRGGVELLAPRPNTGDKIVHFPLWMDEPIFDADRPVLMFMLCWGGAWR